MFAIIDLTLDTNKKREKVWEKRKDRIDVATAPKSDGSIDRVFQRKRLAVTALVKNAEKAGSRFTLSSILIRG
ncbi:hypothetical protein PHSY_002983 [Pseudozyma hubeiensis SY62]|uniref:Uncharacterized protein n=1 Tax=Pseudozyma hubeiensis (strain SY62) TaxID=1305764 RepID=R9P2I0_PSEHS|nr:hypothetical protein PHSY_002983 [Pseudozyma hubeiensis SY62]GAC95407.1 hypothetical protein PHSY_002983 [Pseudozyma hubeiensis SY62]